MAWLGALLWTSPFHSVAFAGPNLREISASLDAAEVIQAKQPNAPVRFADPNGTSVRRALDANTLRGAAQEALAEKEQRETLYPLVSRLSRFSRYYVPERGDKQWPYGKEYLALMRALAVFDEALQALEVRELEAVGAVESLSRANYFKERAATLLQLSYNSVENSIVQSHLTDVDALAARQFLSELRAISPNVRAHQLPQAK